MTHPLSDCSTRYHQFAPSKELASYVACYWMIIGGGQSPASHIRVLPDGCMDIIFDLNGGLAPQDQPDKPCTTPTAFVTGTSFSSVVIPLPQTPLIVGVRFLPGGASSMLGISAHELSQRSAPLMDILPELHRLGTDYIGDTQTPEAMAHIIDSLLLEKRPMLKPINSIVSHAVRAMWNTPGSTRIAALSHSMGISQKRLERAFRSHVGISPKQLSRILRFIHAAQRLQARPQDNLVQLALRLGHTDQPHFNKEFKALAGITPKRWISEQSSVDFLQYTPSVLI